MRWYLSVALGFGYVLNLNCGSVILAASRVTFTMIRDSLLNLVIALDKSFPDLHIIVAYMSLGAAMRHGALYVLWNRWMEAVG